jgi:hypothetical protein
VPHFFTEASWSSKCTPAAPASIIAFISSNALSTPPKAGFGIGHDRLQESMLSSPSAWCSWSARSKVLLMRLTTSGTELAGYSDWSGYISPGHVGVGGDLPAAEVDRLQAGLDLLHRLVAGQRAERVDEVFLVQRFPQPLGAAPGQGVLDPHRAAQAYHVLGAVIALDTRPAGVVPPVQADLFGGRQVVFHVSFQLARGR